MKSKIKFNGHSPASSNKRRYRLKAIKILFFAIFLLILLRCLELQFNSNIFEEIVEQRKEINSHVAIKRGNITDRNEVLLGFSIPYFSVFVNPTQIENIHLVSQELSLLLGINYNKVFFLISHSKNFVWIKKYISRQIQKKINDLQLEGVHVVSDFKRIYPFQNFSAQTIGFVGTDSLGLEGIEYRFNEYLNDKNEKNKTQFSFLTQGGDIQLTLDEKTQYFVEQEVKKAVDTMNASSGSTIVMDSRSGEILALALYPSYNPNFFDKYPVENYRNRIITTPYEPGSTFKIITLAAALEHQIIQSSDKIFCENGSFQIGDRTITDVKKYGVLSIKEIIQKSSNICALKIGLALPKNKFFNTIKKFGFGQKTEISMNGESKGILHDYTSWSNVQTATISYGHSIAVTPLQMISAINVLANDGIYIPPSIIKQPRQLIKKKAPYRVIGSETARILRKMMVSVTQKGGTGVAAAIKGINIAGKTGTARKYDEKTNSYSNKNHILSFVGMFPAEQPKIIILTIVNDPEFPYKNSFTVAPLFKKIALHILHHFPEFRKYHNKIKQKASITKNNTFLSKKTHNTTKLQKKILASFLNSSNKSF